jgi:hypothetical protein
MTLRDKLKINADDTQQEPIWVQSGTRATQTLYRSAIQEYNRIRTLIETNQVNGLKDTQLVLSEIARLASKDKSILNVRRQQALCEWIMEKNTELKSLYREYFKQPKPKKTSTLSALNTENIELRKKVKNQTDAELRAIVEEFFQSNILDDRDKLAREILALKHKNNSLQEKIDRLMTANDNLSRQISELLQS